MPSCKLLDTGCKGRVDITTPQFFWTIEHCIECFRPTLSKRLSKNPELTAHGIGDLPLWSVTVLPGKTDHVSSGTIKDGHQRAIGHKKSSLN